MQPFKLNRFGMCCFSVALASLIVASAHGQGVVSSGSDKDFNLADAGLPNPIAIPAGKSVVQLVAMGVSANDTGYFWWSDGTCSEGSAASSHAYRAPSRFSLPPGQRATDIVGIAVDYTGDVYCYYLDGTVSIGTPYDLDAIDADVVYSLPQGYTTRDIVGAAAQDEDIFLFMRDGSFHVTDIDDYDEFIARARAYAWDRYSVPAGWNTGNILGMDFADSDGRLYTMYTENRSGFGAAQPNNAIRNRILQRDRSRQRRATQNPTQVPTEQQPQDGISVGPDGITVRKDGFSFTLPSSRDN